MSRLSLFVLSVMLAVCVFIIMFVRQRGSAHDLECDRFEGPPFGMWLSGGRTG